MQPLKSHPGVGKQSAETCPFYPLQERARYFRDDLTASRTMRGDAPRARESPVAAGALVAAGKPRRAGMPAAHPRSGLPTGTTTPATPAGAPQPAGTPPGRRREPS